MELTIPFLVQSFVEGRFPRIAVTSDGGLILVRELDERLGFGEVFVDCAEKKGFPGFGYIRQGANCGLRGRRRLSAERMQLRDQGMAVWLMVNGT